MTCLLRETTKDERLGETKVRPEERPKEEKSREVSKPKKESKDKRLGVTKEKRTRKAREVGKRLTISLVIRRFVV